MKCCVESNNTSAAGGSQATTLKPTKMTTTMKPTTKPTQKLEKPTKSDSSKTEGRCQLNGKLQFLKL